MIEIKATGCCAMREIDNLSHAATVQEAMSTIGSMLMAERREVPFVLFSGVTGRVTGDHASSRKDNYGQAFMDYILANKLGNVLRSSERTNPRTANGVTVWIWEPEWFNLKVHVHNLLESRRLGHAIS